MDDVDFQPDYEPDVDDLPIHDSGYIRGATSRLRKGKPCPCCPGRFTNVRRHCIRTHIPWYVVPSTACWQCKLQFGQICLLDGHIRQRHEGVDVGRKFNLDRQESWVELMNGLLKALSDELGYESFSDLCKFASKQVCFEKYSEPVFQKDDLDSISIFNSMNGYDAENISSTVKPPYQTHSLLHWKILCLLILKTENKENFATYEKIRTSRNVIVKPTIVNLIDSHFHLDMYSKKIKDNSLPVFQWKWEDTEYQLSHLIANYCFPRNWPSGSGRSEIRKDSRIYLTFGIHPKIVAMERSDILDKWMTELDDLVKATKVVAVGECGLDTSDAGKLDIKKQLKYLERQLQLAKEMDLPVVIHCRGNNRTDEKCLNCLAQVLPNTYKIHRHCFNGDKDTYHKWKSTFPNCKFGISPFLIMENKYPEFRSVVSGMDMTDLILETDAPYLHPASDKFGSPLLLQDILTKLYGISSHSSDEIANITTSNCLQLYNLH